mmetsp:Transcript_28820/g.93751  ORF Transcript_28820/g.93751 Transcript_28820/m.93751 type:complete len:307 (-) Transcript_28820:1299-2219(-)
MSFSVSDRRLGNTVQLCWYSARVRSASSPGMLSNLSCSALSKLPSASSVMAVPGPTGCPAATATLRSTASLSRCSSTSTNEAPYSSSLFSTHTGALSSCADLVSTSRATSTLRAWLPRANSSSRMPSGSASAISTTRGVCTAGFSACTTASWRTTSSLFSDHSALNTSLLAGAVRNSKGSTSRSTRSRRPCQLEGARARARASTAGDEALARSSSASTRSSRPGRLPRRSSAARKRGDARAALGEDQYLAASSSEGSGMGSRRLKSTTEAGAEASTSSSESWARAWSHSQKMAAAGKGRPAPAKCT